MIQLLKLCLLELDHLLMYKQGLYTKNGDFCLKKAKPYLKATILSLKIYENILNFNFIMGGGGGGGRDGGGSIRHIDCFHRFMKW